MSKYNVDLMLAVREQITSHPETHSQEMWGLRTECGTTYCIAGWAVQLAGEQLVWEGREAAYIARHGEYGYVISVHTAAREHLGLDRDESCDLFRGSLSQADALAKLDALIEKGKNQP